MTGASVMRGFKGFVRGATWASAVLAMAAMDNLDAATVSITGAALDKAIVCRANVDGGVSLAATVTPTFGTDSDVVTLGSLTSSSGTAPNGSSYNRTRTDTRTVTTYSNPTLLVNGAAATAGAQAVSQPVTDGPDGPRTASMTAEASEAKTVEVYTKTVYLNKTGNDLEVKYDPGFPATPGSSTTTTEGAQATSTLGYVVDLMAPAVSDPSLGGGNTVFTEKQSVSGGFKVAGGSADTAYAVEFHILDPNGIEIALGSDQGTMPNASPAGSGIARDLRVGPLAIQIPCGTPPADGYKLVATLKANDLCGNAWDPVDVELGTFTVEPALNLSSQAAVVSQDANGDYVPYTYFTASVNKRRGTVSSNPGSFHLNQVITVPGQCNDVNSVGGLGATLSVPPGFSFTRTGQGFVHVFVGDLGPNLLDYHDPSPVLVELPFPEVLTTHADGSATIRVDLSSLGSIPANWTIYMRAKFNFTNASLPLPASGTVFTFGASDVLTTVNELPYVLDGASTATLTYGLPPVP